jgi:DNA-binding GntR family transcriptional regulator
MGKVSTLGPDEPVLPASAAARAAQSVVALEAILEKRIVDGTFAPGEHLNENALAAELGVSRAPLREACRLLERAGLVEIRPNQGAFVRTLSLGEIINLFDIRASLAELAGRSAASAIDAAGVTRLDALIEQLDVAARDRDADRYIALNLELHAAIYDATANPRLAALDRAMGKELRLYRRHGLAFGGGLLISNQEHRGIVAAIADGDCARAGHELRRHIEGGRDRFLRAMSATGALALAPAASRRRGRIGT